MSRIKEHYHYKIEVQRILADEAIDCLPAGYAEYQFLAAFETLCHQQGGFVRGEEKALQIIKERAFQ